jgi:hypothetical protein
MNCCIPTIVTDQINPTESSYAPLGGRTWFSSCNNSFSMAFRINLDLVEYREPSTRAMRWLIS